MGSVLVCICTHGSDTSGKLYVIYKDKLQYFLSSTQQKKTVEEKSIETFPKSLDWLKYFKQTFNQNFRSVWTFYSHWALSSRHHYNGLLLQRAVPGPPPPDTLTGQLLSLPTTYNNNLNTVSLVHHTFLPIISISVISVSWIQQTRSVRDVRRRLSKEDHLHSKVQLKVRESDRWILYLFC